MRESGEVVEKEERPICLEYLVSGYEQAVFGLLKAVLWAELRFF